MSSSGERFFEACPCGGAESVSTTIIPSDGMLPMVMVCSWSGKTRNIRSYGPLLAEGRREGGRGGKSRVSNVCYKSNILLTGHVHMYYKSNTPHT